VPEFGAVFGHVDLSLVRTMSDAQCFLEWLGQRRDVLGLDTESGGLDHIRHRLRMYQFGDLHKGWAIPWHRWSGLIIEALRKYDGPVVLHNTPHDALFTLQNAPELGPWPWDRTNDTLTIAHLVDPLRSKHLKTFGAMHIDPSAGVAEKDLKMQMAVNKWTWDTVPWDFDPYWVYAAMDPVITAHIYDKFKNETINGPPREAYGLEMATLRVITNMMRKGALVDLVYCRDKGKEIKNYASDMLTYISAKYGVGSVMSASQIISAFDALGLAMPPTFTKGGQQSTDKETLEQIDHDLARYILGIRKIDKTLGPYFGNFLTMADDHNRVHPTIWSMGTRTGRQAVEKPALQQLPKKDPTVRHAFIPSEGCVLITIDADQIEARLIAHFSKDPGMIEAFSGTDDFFVALAQQIFQDQSLHKDDPRRQLTKNAIYGRMYGAGPAKMARTAGVTEVQMREFVMAFDQLFPGVELLQNTINGRGAERKRSEGQASVITPYGRKLVPDEDREYALLNYLIQGHASEILKRCLVTLDAAGFGEFMILPVHDEIVMEVPEELAEEVLRIAMSTMNDYENYAVPITWSGEILDKSWGQKYERTAA
jgi:DNA polymerase I-like protein with 3'-5' exonuclease and polymerase domains